MLNHRSPSRSYQAVHDSEGRRQQIAQFEASLSALRKELNLWWERTGGGIECCQPPQLLAIRSRVRESAELENTIQR
jgi:hypothetical protein